VGLGELKEVASDIVGRREKASHVPGILLETGRPINETCLVFELLIDFFQKCLKPNNKDLFATHKEVLSLIARGEVPN
jgi:hypothetical protein